MNISEKEERLEVDELVDRMFNPARSDGYSTGFKDLDKIVRGVRLGTLTVLGGSTGVGKSLFGLNILKNLAEDGAACTYFDLENSDVVSHERLVSIWSGKSHSYFKSNPQEASNVIWEYSSKIEYFGSDDVERFGGGVETVIKLIAVSKSRVFLVDPLQALETENDSGKILNEQGKIVKALKELAQRKNKAIIICHHLRKSSGGSGEWASDTDELKEIKYRVPSIEDFRGSGKIVDYATDVWGILRTMSSETKEGRGKTLLRVLKNRSGKTGDVRLFFDEDTFKFHGVAPKSLNDMARMFEGGE